MAEGITGWNGPAHDIDEAVYLADRVLVLDLPPHGVHSAHYETWRPA